MQLYVHDVLVCDPWILLYIQKKWTGLTDSKNKPCRTQDVLSNENIDKQAREPECH